MGSSGGSGAGSIPSGTFVDTAGTGLTKAIGTLSLSAATIADIASRALDASVVHLTGNESKTGVLTLIPPALGSSALVIKQVTSQSAAPLRLRNIADTADIYSISSLGVPTFGTQGSVASRARFAHAEPGGANPSAYYSVGSSGSSSFESGAYYDNLGFFGWNADQAQASEPTFGLSLESKFRQGPGDPFGVEMHLVATFPDAVSRRAWSTFVERAAPHAVSTNMLGKLLLNTSAGTTNVEFLDTGGITVFNGSPLSLAMVGAGGSETGKGRITFGPSDDFPRVSFLKSTVEQAAIEARLGEGALKFVVTGSGYVVIEGGPLYPGTAIRSEKGTGALPTYTFNADTNTGMFSPDNDLIGWATAGMERVRLDAGGALALFGGATFTIATYAAGGSGGGEMVFTPSADFPTLDFKKAGATKAGLQGRLDEGAFQVNLSAGTEPRLFVNGGGFQALLTANAQRGLNIQGNGGSHSGDLIFLSLDGSTPLFRVLPSGAVIATGTFTGPNFTAATGRVTADNVKIGQTGAAHGYIRSDDGIYVVSDADNNGGDGAIHFQTSGGGTEWLTLNTPGSGETALYVLANNGAVTLLRRVTVGAADSGGAGNRMLVVAN